MNRSIEATFIDLFAGCGGLSLGLIEAGWKGLFAIEKEKYAFGTLKFNLIEQKQGFKWPKWLPCEPMTVSLLLDKYSKQLEKLQGKVDLMAGGPPCQGFSTAGRRNPADPRNALVKEYLKIVAIVQPKMLLIENVRGFKAPFIKKDGTKTIYSDLVIRILRRLGYVPFHQILNAASFGVPQKRERFIMIAIHEKYKTENPFILLKHLIPSFREKKGLPKEGFVSSKDALSDLETEGKQLIPCEDFQSFQQIKYIPSSLTNYQKLMRKSVSDSYSPNSLRLPKHRSSTKERFKKILNTCIPGKTVPKKKMLILGTRKNCLAPLNAFAPSRTITTLPDDLLHYSEPRILTVRENARLQSFPDWFVFTGKYTTGGHLRKKECPRYTQVGNAVPPLMAEALATLILDLKASL